MVWKSVLICDLNCAFRLIWIYIDMLMAAFTLHVRRLGA